MPAFNKRCENKKIYMKLIFDVIIILNCLFGVFNYKKI